MTRFGPQPHLLYLFFLRFSTTKKNASAATEKAEKTPAATLREAWMPVMPATLKASAGLVWP